MVGPDGRKSYIVRMLIKCGARITKPGPNLGFRFDEPEGPLEIAFHPFEQEEGFEVPIPRGLAVRAVGSARSLDEAVNEFSAEAAGLTGVLSLSANAHVPYPTVERAYPCRAVDGRRDFFQRFVPRVEGWPTQGRRIHVAGTGAIMSQLADHPERSRLFRAIGQYQQALAFFSPGRELGAIAHFFMSVEALTKAFIRGELGDPSLPNNVLADRWGIRVKDLDREVRLRLIFSGDARCYTNLKEASDGLEHGYSDFHELREFAKLADHKRVASYVRSAIFRLLDLPEPYQSELLGARYAVPLEEYEYSREVRGVLLGGPDDLDAGVEPGPRLEWSGRIDAVERRSDGRITFKPVENLKASLPEGMQIQLSRGEVYGPTREPAWDEVTN